MDTKQPTQDNNQNNAPQNVGAEPQKPAQPKYTTLKEVVISLILIAVLLGLIGLISKLINKNDYSEIQSTLNIIVVLVSPIISVLIVRQWEKKKYPQAYSTNPNQTNNMKATLASDASTLLLSLLFGVLVFIVCAGVTGGWASAVCISEGGNDCGVGWFYGLFLLPGSFIAALILGPILAGIFVKHRKKKK